MLRSGSSGYTEREWGDAFYRIQTEKRERD
jgi:hypothetical protein